MDSWTFPDLFLHSVPDHCVPLRSPSSSSSSSNSSSSGSPAAAASANWLDSILPQPWMDSLQPLPAQPGGCSQNNIASVVSRSSFPVQEPTPPVNNNNNNNNKAPQRRRNTKKRAAIQEHLIVDDNNMIGGGGGGGAKSYRTSACRVVSERQRRKILGDSILALKALLPLNQSKQIDKCSILKEAGKHILTLKEEMQELVKKKEDLSAKKVAAAPELLSTSKEKEMAPNSVNAVVPDDDHNVTDVKEKERVTLHYCNGSSAFLTVQIPAVSGSEMRLSTVLSALEKANVDIINVVTSWTQDSRSFRLMAHTKKIGDAASVEALKEDLLRIACWR